LRKDRSKQARERSKKETSKQEANHNPHVLGFGRCLSFTKPHVLAQRGKKNAKIAKSKLSPSCPKGHMWEEAIPLLLPQL
jgi:hypothetical protein